MADNPRPLTRAQLAEFLPNQRAIRAFEELFKLANEIEVDGIGNIATIRAVTASTGQSIDDYTVLLDGTLESVTYYLLSAIPNPGRVVTIKCTNDTFACNVAPFGTEEIDNTLGAFPLFRDESITLHSDGAQWRII